MTADEKTVPWDLWQVDDALRVMTRIEQGGQRGEMLKQADRLNEGAKPGSKVRYIAQPEGSEPDFMPVQKPQPVRAAIPPAPAPHIHHRWVCVMEGSDDAARCSAARPHGTSYRCGFWYDLTVPANVVTDDVMRLAAKLLRIGALTQGAPAQRPPSY